MGQVYMAHDLRLGNALVAVKVPLPRHAKDPTSRRRFHRESEAAAALGHPHILSARDTGEDGDVLFMVMDFVNGETLATRLARREFLDPRTTLEYLAPVADALDTAHRAGLVHRDVKPSNILIAHAGKEHIYLTDFGIARDVSLQFQTTSGGQVIGTLPYMAPEQIRGEQVDGRADLYSLSCVAFECLTGRLPFDHPDPESLKAAHVRMPPPAASALRDGLPRAVDGVLARGLAKDPTDRYPTCVDFVLALEEVIVPEAADYAERVRVRATAIDAAGSDQQRTSVNVADVTLAEPEQNSGGDSERRGAAPTIAGPPATLPDTRDMSQEAVTESLRGGNEPTQPLTLTQPRTPRRRSSRPVVAVISVIGVGVAVVLAFVFIRRTPAGRPGGLAASHGRKAAISAGPPASASSHEPAPTATGGPAPTPIAGAVPAVVPSGVFIYVRDTGKGAALRVLTGAEESQTFAAKRGSNNFDPSVSPDGSRVAFASDRDGTHDIYVINRDKTGLKRKSLDAKEDVEPAISATGELAFASNRNGQYHIFIEPVDAATVEGGIMAVTTGPNHDDRNPSWSPRGDRIVFERTTSGATSIWIIAVGGGPASEIAGTDSGTQPAWSPDGKWIAFIRGHAPARKLWLVHPDGTGLHLVQTPPGDISDPVWAPNSAQIAFIARSVAAVSPWLVPVQGGAAIQLALPAPDGVIDLAWGP